MCTKEHYYIVLTLHVSNMHGFLLMQLESKDHLYFTEVIKKLPQQLFLSFPSSNFILPSILGGISSAFNMLVEESLRISEL